MSRKGKCETDRDTAACDDPVSPEDAPGQGEQTVRTDCSHVFRPCLGVAVGTPHPFGRGRAASSEQRDLATRSYP